MRGACAGGDSTKRGVGRDNEALRPALDEGLRLKGVKVDLRLLRPAFVQPGLRPAFVQPSSGAKGLKADPVSYTHLTLPTSDLV